MAEIQMGDYVIWQKKRLCRVVATLPPVTFLGAPPTGTVTSDIKPAGLTQNDWDQIKSDATRYRVIDLNDEEEFDIYGFDLIYVNEMVVLAVMAKKDD